MKKVVLMIAIGVAIGYWLGWKDAQVNQDDVVTRLVEHAGGKTRASIKSDADQTMDSLEH